MIFDGDDIDVTILYFTLQRDQDIMDLAAKLVLPFLFDLQKHFKYELLIFHIYYIGVYYTKISLTIFIGLQSSNCSLSHEVNKLFSRVLFGEFQSVYFVVLGFPEVADHAVSLLILQYDIK